MHVRAAANVPGLYHDITDRLPDDEDGFCSGGNQSGLGSMMGCLRTVIGGLPPSQVTVLWATDNDKLSSGLLAAVQEVASVVWIDHELTERHDVGCWSVEGGACSASGLADLELLGGGDVLITSPGSTYSFVAHARGLIRPHLGSFFGPEGTCVQAPGSEAGLYMRDTGAMHDDCKTEGEHISCRSAREGCVSAMASHFQLGGCLQTVAPCAQADGGLLDSYVAELRHSVMIQSWMARYGFHFSAPYPHIRMPACTDDETKLRRDAQWRLVDVASAEFRAGVAVDSGDIVGYGDHGLGWQARPGSAIVFSFDGPHEVWSVQLAASRTGCDHVDAFSMWATMDTTDPHNGHETRDAATLLVKAKWRPIQEELHSYEAPQTTLIISDGQTSGVTATALKIRVDELCGSGVKAIRIQAIPLAESLDGISKGGGSGADVSSTVPLRWSSVAEKRQGRLRAFLEREAMGECVKIVGPVDGSEMPRQVGRQVGDASVFHVGLRVRVLRGALARLIESDEAVGGGQGDDGLERILGLTVWLDGVQLEGTLPVVCQSGIVSAERTSYSDPMETCEATGWLPATAGEHKLSVSLFDNSADDVSFRVVPWTHVTGDWFQGVSNVFRDPAMYGGDSFAGLGDGGGGGRTIVLSTVSGNLLHLIYQVRAWQRWCTDDFEFVAVLNHNPARKGRFRIENFNPDGARTVCKELGVRLMEVTFDVGGVENHQVLLEWVWQSLVLPHCAGKRVFVAITESDVFPIDFFSIPSFLKHGECAVGGKNLGTRDKARYVHPGFTYFAMHKMPYPERWCFVGLIITLNGHEHLLDTGGCSYLYLSRFQTSDNFSPPTAIPPRHVTPGEADQVRAYYAGWADKVDKNDPIGFSSVVDHAPAYRDFDADPSTGHNAGSPDVKACWLGQHDHQESALTVLPLDCRNLTQAPLRTTIQQAYCDLNPDGSIALFEGGQPVGGPFVHVGCGSGWCGAYDSLALQTAKLARADAWLQYVQVLYGCECVHCEVAKALRLVGIGLPAEAFFHDGRCHDADSNTSM